LSVHTHMQSLRASASTACVSGHICFHSESHFFHSFLLKITAQLYALQQLTDFGAIAAPLYVLAKEQTI